MLTTAIHLTERTIMNRTIVRLGGVLLASAGLLLPSAAWGHVSVSSTDASREGYGKIVFRVPNESDKASTTKLTVTLPQDTPFAFLTAQVKPGWKATITKAKLPKPTKVGDATLSEAPRTVTWTTTGDGIAPGEFDEFALSGGPFPDAETISFQAKQTYDDGEVVDWAQVQEEGAEEPEHPAPTLQLLAATSGGHHGGAASDEKDADTASHESSGSDGLARGAAGAAFLVALAALVMATRRGARA